MSNTFGWWPNNCKTNAILHDSWFFQWKLGVEPPQWFQTANLVFIPIFVQALLFSSLLFSNSPVHSYTPCNFLGHLLSVSLKNGCHTPSLPAASALHPQATAINKHVWLGNLSRQMRLQKDIITTWRVKPSSHTHTKDTVPTYIHPFLDSTCFSLWIHFLNNWLK